MVNKELMVWLPIILLISALTFYEIVRKDSEGIIFLIYLYGGILLFLGIIKWINYWDKK